MKRLLIGMLLCCGLTTHAQLTLSLSGSQTTINGNLANGTNLPVAGINASGTPSGSTYLRGDGAWATPAGGSGDSYIFTNAAAGGLRFTNDFGLGAFADANHSSLTATGIVTFIEGEVTPEQVAYSSQGIYYQGATWITFPTGTIMDMLGNPSIYTQTRSLQGNWNANADLDVDGDLNVDGTATYADVIVTNLFTSITNAIITTDGNGVATNLMIGSGLSLTGTTLSATGGGGGDSFVISISPSPTTIAANTTNYHIPFASQYTSTTSTWAARAWRVNYGGYITNLMIAGINLSGSDYTGTNVFGSVLVNTTNEMGALMTMGANGSIVYATNISALSFAAGDTIGFKYANTNNAGVNGGYSITAEIVRLP